MKALHGRLIPLISIILVQFYCCNGFEFSAGNKTCDPLIIQTTQACFKIEGKNMKWKEAKEHCLEQNAVLATPASKGVNDEIKEFIKPLNDECSNDSKYKFWIGVRMKEKVFHFVGNHTALPYTDWDPEFPNPSDVPETLGCALYRCDNNRYSWKPNMCSEKSHFICQMQECPSGCHIVTTTVEPTTQATTESTTMMTSTLMFSDETTVEAHHDTTNKTGPHHSRASKSADNLWFILPIFVILIHTTLRV